MSQENVPLVVLTDREENVEFINRTLHDAGHAVRCHWIDGIDRVAEALEKYSPELLWLFNDGNAAEIKRVAQSRSNVPPIVPLLVVRENVDESAIADAMLAGAQDLVSVHHVERLHSAAERELRAFQLERALNRTILSAAQDRRQLSKLKAGTEDAIACAQEGILVETNLAWAQLFGYDDGEVMQGLPIMDFFEPRSQTTLKGGLVACTKEHWGSESLRVTALTKTARLFPWRCALNDRSSTARQP